MHRQQISEDIKTFYVQAESFPDGILAAFEKLDSKLGETKGRDFYGLSRMERGGGIVYRAAVKEAYDGEGAALGCNTFIIPQGTYLAETLHNWKGQEQRIGNIFGEMIKDPRVAADGFCLEHYQGDDVQCLVPINEEKPKP